MADPQTTSTAPAQTWDQAQAQIQQAQLARIANEQRAAEAAFRAAAGRPGGEKDIMNPFPGNVQYTTAPPLNAASAKPTKRGKKG
jgi:hypothetical protein